MHHLQSHSSLENLPGEETVRRRDKPGKKTVRRRDKPGKETVRRRDKPGKETVRRRDKPWRETVRRRDKPGEETVRRRDKPGKETVRRRDKPVKETVRRRDKPGKETVRRRDKPGKETVRRRDKPGKETVRRRDKPGKETVRRRDKPGKETVRRRDKPGKETVRRRDKPEEETVSRRDKSGEETVRRRDSVSINKDNIRVFEKEELPLAECVVLSQSAELENFKDDISQDDFRNIDWIEEQRKDYSINRVLDLLKSGFRPSDDDCASEIPQTVSKRSKYTRNTTEKKQESGNISTDSDSESSDSERDQIRFVSKPVSYTDRNVLKTSGVNHNTCLNSSSEHMGSVLSSDLRNVRRHFL
ncbi:uncharacterized protein LOC125672503 [Ostrea edulis]|uniref:uncharacterized protein LOC125672503 n=1 Tax=Ostrea edulis TaxID=37623 RepID=UPI0024AF69B0|nr:uncharacterized protein LOC125672503 [Ostrea edulis]